MITIDRTEYLSIKSLIGRQFRLSEEIKMVNNYSPEGDLVYTILNHLPLTKTVIISYEINGKKGAVIYWEVLALDYINEGSWLLL